MLKSILLSVLMLGMATLIAAQEQHYAVGDTVPDFNLPYATRDSIIIEGIGPEDLEGQRFLMAFYPAAWSPGCTNEMCTFRDAITEFEKLDIEVLPISGDYVFSHHEWAKHHNLPFKLVADHTRSLAVCRRTSVY